MRYQKQDHPRVCGEKPPILIVFSMVQGSPPRMRGKAGYTPQRSCSPGITPAYAGKSWSAICFRQYSQDHPRVCGEKKDMIAAGINPIGSPPRMRGKGYTRTFQQTYKRITPAYAGKSRRHQRPCKWLQDHPRVCGEKKEGGSRAKTRLGSPPRMRGKVKENQTLWYEDRITPAYAGKSSINLAQGISS